MSRTLLSTICNQPMVMRPLAAEDPVKRRYFSNSSSTVGLYAMLPMSARHQPAPTLVAVVDGSGYWDPEGNYFEDDT